MIIGRSDGWRRISSLGRRENIPFVALLIFLPLTFAIGGGSRSDVQSLVLLRPMAVLFCGLATLTLRPVHWQSRRGLVTLAAAVFLLVGVQLIPLPSGIWSQFPGRELVSHIDATAGLGDIWRPLTLSPTGTRNALFALFVPLAALLLGIQLTRAQLTRVAMAVLIVGLLSGMLGLLQSIGPTQGPLYLYRITNHGAAVGLFSNRNHQAIFLATLFPLLALYASQTARSPDHARFKLWVALAAGLFLVPLLLVTGSRAGLVLGVVAIAASLKLYTPPPVSGIDRRRHKPRSSGLLWLGIGGGVLALGLLGILMSRAEALQRIANGDVGEDLRFQVWGPIADLMIKNFPVGTGFGSFPNIYQVQEAYGLLIPNYLNHAHNDWLEVALEGGLPAVAFVGIAGIFFLKAAVGLLRKRKAPAADAQLALTGALIIIIFAAGSVADYPLRTPSIACVAILAALWMTNSRSPDAKDAGNASPNTAGIVPVIKLGGVNA